MKRAYQSRSPVRFLHGTAVACALLIVVLTAVSTAVALDLFEKVVITRDDTIHEAMPDLAIAANGDLVLTYQEEEGHGLGPVSTIVTRTSSDWGQTWSEKHLVIQCEREADAEGNWISGERVIDSKITRLQDNSMIMVMDVMPQGVSQELEVTVNYTSRSYDNGQSWSTPKPTSVRGTVPDIIQLKDGALLMGASRNADLSYATYDLYTTASRSTDNGYTWSEQVVVADHPQADEWASEGAFVQLDTGEIVCYMRSKGYNVRGIKAISTDGGQTWSGPYGSGNTYYRAQPGVGVLSTGEVLVTSRTTPDRWYGAYCETQAMALLQNPLGAGPPAGSINFKIDYEDHPTRRKDYGMGDWVELPDGTVYVASHINDGAPEQKTYILGYLIPHSECSSLPVPDFKPTGPLLAHYKFDGNTLNSVSYSPHGTSRGDAGVPQYVGGVSVHALQFDASDYQAVNTTTSGYPNGTANVGAVSFWAKTTEPGAAEPNFASLFGSLHTPGKVTAISFNADNTTSATPGRLRLALRSQESRWFQMYSNPIGEGGISDWLDGQWHHIVVTWDSTNDETFEGAIYIDGVVQPLSFIKDDALSTDTFVTPTTTPMLLGATGHTDAAAHGYAYAPYNGALDDFQVYGVMLSANDIKWLYNHPGELLPWSMLIKLPGDANQDGVVDDVDATIMAVNWQATRAGGADWSMGDFNGDGKVDDRDAFVLAQHWHERLTAAAATSTIPEPAVLAMLAGILLLPAVSHGRRAAAV